MTNTALITGASSGIGKELAYLHAAQHGNLILVARSIDKLNDIKNELETKFGISVTTLQKDLTQPNAPKEIYNEIKEKNWQVDYLINNAGFGGVGKFYERELNKDLQMISLNIIALTALTHLFLKDFVKNNNGKILNVSSTASLIPGPMQAVYFATKAYVTSFSNAIAEELHDTNVTVTNLMPGATETNFGATSGMDKTALFNNPSSAKNVAKKGYEGMLNGDLDVITGLSLGQKIMLNLAPLTPKKVILKQVRKMQKTKI